MTIRFDDIGVDQVAVAVRQFAIMGRAREIGMINIDAERANIIRPVLGVVLIVDAQAQYKVLETEGLHEYDHAVHPHSNLQ